MRIKYARSMNNGIIFYSERHEGYIAIATAGECDEIKTQWTTIEKSKYEKFSDIGIILLGIPFAIIYGILVMWAISKSFLLGIRVSCGWFAITQLSILIIGTFIGRKVEEEKYKFHSAEHMVINAYKKLKRVPTLEEIRKFSRFNKKCGTNSITSIVLKSMLMFFCTFIHNPLFMLIGMITANNVVNNLMEYRLLSFMQIFTTSVPTDKELVVAIAGMSVWIENEKKE